MDRIDIFSFVNDITYKQLFGEKNTDNESSESIQKRVKCARKIQRNRFKKYGFYCNSDMKEDHIKKFCKLNDATSRILELVYTKYHLSTRACNKILKLSRTIADLDNAKNINKKHIMEAIQYRKFLNDNII